MTKPPSWNYWAYKDEERSPEADERDAEYFHGDDCDADYRKWVRKGFWSAEQATALSFGKAPERVTRTYVEDEAPGPSLFAEYFTFLHDKILEAQRRAELTMRIQPRSYIEWAKLNDVDFPSDLEAAIVESEEEIDEIRERNSELEEQSRAQREEIQKLRYELDRIRSDKGMAVASVPAPETGSGETRSRQTLLKLLLVMAVKKYNFRTDAEKQAATTNIANDTDQLGLSVSDDTVRKWLAEAKNEFGNIFRKGT